MKGDSRVSEERIQALSFHDERNLIAASLWSGLFCLRGID